jgi:hypothetical protein
MRILRVPIGSVEPWDKNPRGIMKADFERLKRQIQKLGVYKPLVCYDEGGKYVVLGGNMRIRALKELGHTEVDISLVAPKTDADRVEYALSDNDRAGFYEEDKLAELLDPFKADIPLEDYKIDLGMAIEIAGIIGGGRGPEFKEYDETAGDGMSLCRCPACGHEHARQDK